MRGLGRAGSPQPSPDAAPFCAPGAPSAPFRYPGAADGNEGSAGGEVARGLPVNRWRSYLAILVALGVVSLAAAMAYRAARRDRDALLTAFAEDRIQRLHDEIRDIEVDISDIR